MNNPTKDIRAILGDSSSIFIAVEPDVAQLNNCETLYDVSSEYKTDVTTQIETCKVQIRIRNNSYETGYALGQSYFDTLHNYINSSYNGSIIIDIKCLSGVTYLTKIDNNYIFVMNFKIMRKSTTWA